MRASPLLTHEPCQAQFRDHNSFCEAYRALNRFRGESSLETWFYRILVRRTRYLVRRQRALDRWIRFFGKGSGPQTSPAPVEPELRDRIGIAVAKLSAGQREVFVLMYLEGFSTARVAALLERSEGTVKSHLHRALKRLRHELRDLAPLNEGAKS